MCQLLDVLSGDAEQINEIAGLGYKVKNETVLNQVQCSFEMLDYRDLPYHLVDISGEKYNRLGNGEIIFPIFTAVGCPYKCNFCMSPAVYKKIKGKKWIPNSVDYVMEHIEYLKAKYSFKRLQIYDDDSFVDLERMRCFFKAYIEKGYHKEFKIDFRGARINELDRMDDEFLSLMVTAGVEIMAIGVESGSDKILKLMNKGIHVEQILRVNEKLSRYPSLKPHYNFFCGIPGESFETLIETKEVLLQMIDTHPGCYLGVGADWKPLPGSVMTERAVEEYHLQLPGSLEAWAKIDSFDADKLEHPWYTKEINNMIKLLQLAGQFLDNKIFDFQKELGPILGKAVQLLANLYKPVLRFRLKYNFTTFLIEYRIKIFALRSVGKLMRAFK